MRIMVTGSKGFVGTATKQLLRQKNHKVLEYDIMDGWDICSLADVQNFIIENEVDKVLHLAAIARFDECDDNPVRAFETNVMGTKNIVDSCKIFHIPLVHASTGSVYMPVTDDPPITEHNPIRGNSVYGCTKCTGELYVSTVQPHIILRYAHLYGPEKRNAGLIGNFISRVKRGLSPMVYGGSQSTDFLYIDDVARANVAALEAPWPAWNNAYNIGSGEEMTADYATKIIADITDYEGEIQHTASRLVDTTRFVYDISKAKEKLGWEPKFTFEEGIIDMNDKGVFK